MSDQSEGSRPEPPSIHFLNLLNPFWGDGSTRAHPSYCRAKAGYTQDRTAAACKAHEAGAFAPTTPAPREADWLPGRETLGRQTARAS